VVEEVGGRADRARKSREEPGRAGKSQEELGRARKSRKSLEESEELGRAGKRPAVTHPFPQEDNELIYTTIRGIQLNFCVLSNYDRYIYFIIRDMEIDTMVTGSEYPVVFLVDRKKLLNYEANMLEMLVQWSTKKSLTLVDFFGTCSRGGRICLRIEFRSFTGFFFFLDLHGFFYLTELGVSHFFLRIPTPPDHFQARRRLPLRLLPPLLPHLRLRQGGRRRRGDHPTTKEDRAVRQALCFGEGGGRGRH
jgi:hypothetical protein